MSSCFPHSSRHLHGDGFRRCILFLICVSTLLGTWICWFLLARIDRYEVTGVARVEVDLAGHPLQSRLAGRIAATTLRLGREVVEGEVLVELETGGQRLQVQEERTKLMALGPQIAALRQETGAQERARGEERIVSHVAGEQAGAQLREAGILSKLADEEAGRAKRLRAEGILSESEFQRSRAESQRRQAELETLRLAIGRLDPEQRVREYDRDARVNQLQGSLTRLEGQIVTTAATIKRLQYEIEKCVIRAPINGRLAEVAVLRPGSYVAEGEKLAVVLPRGNYRVIAEFSPPAALGRVRRGQPAILRLQGFPWTQYGSVSATVGDVAGEIRDGSIRVELNVNPNSHFAATLQHGMPGTVEVKVERVSPAELVLRAAGRLATQPRTWFEPRVKSGS